MILKKYLKYCFPVLLLIFISFILAKWFPATNHSPINAKVSGSVRISLRQLIGEVPISISSNKNKMELTDTESMELRSKVNALLDTLEPTHQISYLPLKNYLMITYQKYDQYYKLYFPLKKNQNPENNIYLKGQDNGKDVFYQLSGGEIETFNLIDSEIVKK